ncbi:glycosyl hydrolase family 47-domain-containing protein [Aspergillus foveolatus]|uniref:glycosyl hydrolase family 47-domain-containing protein n=1 Tax=Aspergillus foveolatus TaxID=210207 RepID=UPI003CCD9923
MRLGCWRLQMSVCSAGMTGLVLLLSLCVSTAQGMRSDQIRHLRTETEQMFYHGFENYLEHAFPEDELRPLSCEPLVRDRQNPGHAELNDVLGNYSLTLIDSLSTLAILASSPDDGAKAWQYFQDGIKDFVRLYGDGSDGATGQGERSRGFDIDSKVQVFETVIRGLGGLLSSHLFAVGDLPITRYSPPAKEAAYAKAWDKTSFAADSRGIAWDNGFVYDGQLLRLAVDLANRILPAFYTHTGLPYPRVNLRHGVHQQPFYANSPLNADTVRVCDDKDGNACDASSAEVTETCSAGAGSLVLEFTLLSRLTGDGRYEELAKRAFWAVWYRRSDIGLIGAGIDAESGKWVAPFTGIGAGVDSFFEYAFKSYVLLSSGERPEHNRSSPWHALDDYFLPLSEYEHSPEAFLQVWEESHSSIKRHLYRGEGYQHPHLIQGDIFTGATRAFWIDSLSAFYPGLLSLAGDLDEAIGIHLLTTAVWNRFAGLPERWNVATGNVEGNLGWYGGRPEFIESTYYLYQATKDPWYLHVGEMVLRDLKRRCWTRCGWAGLQDVRNGELSDRMESFFLGETAKYMFLLYHPEHPLNHLDQPFVFTTEAHPLLIPKSIYSTQRSSPRKKKKEHGEKHSAAPTCQAAPLPPAFGLSSTAARPDVFHAANLARLDLMPSRGPPEGPLEKPAKDRPGVTIADLTSPTNYTFFPWTLPLELIPFNATSSLMAIRPTLDISFPAVSGMVHGPGSLERVQDGVLVKSIGGLRMSMIKDASVQVINGVPLGKDEKVYLLREITFDVLDPGDPNFTRVRDPAMIDLIIDIVPENLGRRNDSDDDREPAASGTGAHQRIINANAPIDDDKAAAPVDASTSSMRNVLSSLVNSVASLLQDEPRATRLPIPAAVSTGLGSGPLPDVDDSPLVSINGGTSQVRLPWFDIYMADDLCDQRILRSVAQTHQKLRNIAAHPPSKNALKLVIVNFGPGYAARLAEPQVTAGGIPRRHLLSMVLVGGGDETYELLRQARGDGLIPPTIPTTATTAINPSSAQHTPPDIAPKNAPKHLYFAYGSNLSPTQMRMRCVHNPTLSGHPVALAALDSWRWLICQPGYANVVPPAGLRVGPQITEGDNVPESISKSMPRGGVYGVLYEMSAEDETVLDGYEGVHYLAGESMEEQKVPLEIRPKEQGDGDYNKWYVDARVVKWFDEGYRERKGLQGVGGKVRVLVYVDELRVKVGKPKEEYIPRMNRAIGEAVQLGFPRDWAEEVMRPSIPLE